MVAYRFCRPDDIPELVVAINDCFGVHFPARPAGTVESYRTEMRRLSVWPSNCMMAREAGDSVGVIVGTKREEEVLIRHLGVRSDWQGRGLGTHLVTSLSQKLAVLGPPRLVVELPAEDRASRRFFQRLGFEAESELADWEREAPASALPLELFSRVGVADLEAVTELGVGSGIAWRRQVESLRGSAEELGGWAVAGPDRLEAWLLFEPDPAGATVWAWGGAEPGSGDWCRLFDLLCRRLQSSESGRIRLGQLAPAEADRAGVERLGFSPTASYHRLAARATPA